MPKLNYDLDDIPDVPVIPEGRYKAKLVKVEKGISGTGNPKLVFTWKVKGGKHDGMTIMTHPSLLENALSGLKQHLIALGAKGKIKGSTDKYLGKFVIIIVGKRLGRDRLGEEVEFSTVLGVLPPDSKVGLSKSGKGKPKRRVVEEEDEEDEDEEEDDEEEGDEEEEEEDEGEEEDEDEDEEDEDEDEEEEPLKKSKSAKKKKSRADDEEDEDEDLPF